MIPRTPRMPRLLRRVVKSLRHINDQPSRPLDLNRIRDRFAEFLPPAGAAGEQATADLDVYIDTHVAEWRREQRVRHEAVLGELDLLVIDIEQVRKQFLTLHEDRNVKLSDLEGAVSHAMDRVSDPDNPYLSPGPRKRHGGNRP
jgi:cytosine/adenosine deaminase-related metal-dependent hydrolase